MSPVLLEKTAQKIDETVRHVGHFWPPYRPRLCPPPKAPPIPHAQPPEHSPCARSKIVALSQPAEISSPPPSNDPARSWSCARGRTWRLNPLTVEGPSTRTRRPSITLTMTQSFPTFLPKLQRQTRPVSTRRLSVVDCEKEREGYQAQSPGANMPTCPRLALQSPPSRQLLLFWKMNSLGTRFQPSRSTSCAPHQLNRRLRAEKPPQIPSRPALSSAKHRTPPTPPRLHAVVLQCHLLMPIPGRSAPLLHQNPASTRRPSDPSISRYVTNLPKPTTLGSLQASAVPFLTRAEKITQLVASTGALSEFYTKLSVPIH